MRIIRIVTVFLFLALAAKTVSAQNESVLSGSLLWKISGKGLSQPSYILATHHLIHTSFIDSIPGIGIALASTNQTVGEIVMTDQVSLRAKMDEASILPATEGYDKLLSPEDYAKLDNGLKAYLGAGLEQYGNLKPGMISILYLITMYTNLYPEFSFTSHEGMDTYLQRIAKSNGKTILGLETPEEQIYALFDVESQKRQAETLVCMISNSDALKGTLKILNAYYREAKLYEMYNLIFDNQEDICTMSESQEEALVKDRNDKWLKKIPQIMHKNSSLIAVGSLHLGGKVGLLNQLAVMGYKVEAVKQD